MAIVFSKENRLSVEDLAAGDIFGMVFFGVHGRSTSITGFTVERVLKREVVCKKRSGEEARFSKSKTYDNCYLINDPAFLAIIETIRKANKVALIISRLRDLRQFEIADDEEFMVAAEAFLARLDAIKKAS